MNIAGRAGGWSARHRRKAVLGWLGFVLLAVVIGQAAGVNRLLPPDNGNGESQRADRLIDAHFPRYAEERVFIQGKGSVKPGDPAFAHAVADVIRRLRRVPWVRDIKSPLARGGTGQISDEHRAGLVTFKVLGDREDAEKRVQAALAATAAAQRANPALRIEEVGDASFDKAVSKEFEDSLRQAETTSLPVTLAILLVAFGAVVAAGIPLLLGATAVMGTLGLLGPISHLVPLDDATSSVVLLIGLAVGVDYSMFYLRRKLDERAAGRSNEDALATAAATSGRAVLLSGLTVMVAMAGMLLAGNAVFVSFGIGTMLVVAVALIGSVTVLPAVLSKLRDNVEKGRVPIIAGRRRRAHGEPRVWGFIVDRVLRYPAVSLALGAGLLLLLAAPALDMRTVSPGFSMLPRDIPIVRSYDRVQTAFPGGPQPAIVAVNDRDVSRPTVVAAINNLSRTGLGTGELFGPVTRSVSPDKKVALVSFSLPGDGTDQRSEAALSTLRGDVVPATVGLVSGASGEVTGQTAQSVDFDAAMRSHLPIVFAFVLGLAFLLLLVTFRSLVIPLTAIVLNLLSVGAAYGVLKLVFQDGRLESLIGFHSVQGVITWLPLFLFVILFGLSMDYHVLILSRIREGVDRGLSTEEAVSTAIKATAGVVTSAAVVMVVVFAIFATLGIIVFKMMGVGLAVAVFIDATIVRVVLVPSVMKLLGPWNWYLPRRLEWMPQIGPEGGLRPKGPPSGA